jgi:hypothetical protein
MNRRLIPSMTLILVLLLSAGTAQASGKLAGVATVELTPATWRAQLDRYRDAEGAFREGTLFRFAPGHYRFEPTPYEEQLCGNCEDPATAVKASVGLRIGGLGIVLESDPGLAGEVVLHTNAGYGLLFEDCEDCVLRGVTVTDGVRDPDPNATCAALLVRRSSLTMEDCDIRDNLGDSTLLATNVVGIAGIAGREGARMRILGNRILRNSWDGIALYRGAQAKIEDNLIDGVDKAGAGTRGGGRGVGIGLTWDARAELRRNRVTRYWKGIGVFVDARAIIEENLVEEMLTWGIAVWDAGRGRPRAVIRRNLIFDTGACGISITRTLAGEPAPGDCAENLLARTGGNERYDAPEHYCAQCPIAVHALPAGFELGENWLWGNRRATTEGSQFDRGGADLTDTRFIAETTELIQELKAHPSLAGGRAFRELPRGAITR